MFAFFGLGVQELIILMILGVLLCAPVAIVFMFLNANRPKPDDRLADLEEENRRLRERLDEAGK